MNCISCNKPTVKGIVYWKCIDCGIIHSIDYANRLIGYDYEIEWYYGSEEDISTSILKAIWIPHQWVMDTIYMLDGLKLFDVRTEEQIEKLLVLI
jgi:hypothetical protein